MTAMAIIGSRDFPNPTLVKNFVLSLPADTVVVSGGARGVDTWAEKAALKRGLKVLIFRVSNDEWAANPKLAGYDRNEIVVANSDEVVAFHDGKSKGTLHTINEARKAKKRVTVYKVDGSCVVYEPLVQGRLF